MRRSAWQRPWRRITLPCRRGFVQELRRFEFATMERVTPRDEEMSAIPERIGKYRIIRELGRGATAVVYLAECADYPEPVALKHVRFGDRGRDEAKWSRRLIKLLRAEQAVSQRAADDVTSVRPPDDEPDDDARAASGQGSEPR